MSASSAADAYDLLAHTGLTVERLLQAQEELSKHSSLDQEQAWLENAIGLLQAAHHPLLDLLKRSVRLPELAPAREEYAKEVQNQWVDALERLQAGMTFHLGSRTPILETLYPKQKLASLRRASAEVMRAYHKEFQKRLNGSYVQRMLGTPELAFAHPLLDQLTQLHLQWESLHAADPAPIDELERMREELIAAAQEVAVPLKQARLLAEAALSPLPGAFETSSIGGKIRRRALRLSDAEADDETTADDPAPEEGSPAPAPAQKTG